MVLSMNKPGVNNSDKIRQHWQFPYTQFMLESSVTLRLKHPWLRGIWGALLVEGLHHINWPVQCFTFYFGIDTLSAQTWEDVFDWFYMFCSVNTFTTAVTDGHRVKSHQSSVQSAGPSWYNSFKFLCAKELKWFRTLYSELFIDPWGSLL